MARLEDTKGNGAIRNIGMNRLNRGHMITSSLSSLSSTSSRTNMATPTTTTTTTTQTYQGRPDCRYGMYCRKRPYCLFVHPESSCRFGLECKNRPNCPYTHPKSECRYGTNCSKQPNCPFFHSKGACSNGVGVGDSNSDSNSGNGNNVDGRHPSHTYTHKKFSNPSHEEVKSHKSEEYDVDENAPKSQSKKPMLQNQKLYGKSPNYYGNHKSADFNILLVGETGSGKSTFINTITNFCRGGTLNKMRVAIPTKYLPATEEFLSMELQLQNSATSKTDACTFYRFNAGGCNFNLIDTPGLSDTRGTEQDDKNLEKIAEAGIKAQVINAIIFIINGTTPRLTVNLRNVIRRLRGFLPDVLLQNILVVFTNCHKTTCNFDIHSLNKEFVPHQVFYTNNAAFSSNPKTWAPADMKHLLFEWDNSMEVINEIFTTVVNMKSTIASAFEDIKHLRHQIREQLHKARLQITQLQQIQDEITIAEQALAKYGADERQFANYTQKKTVTKTELVDASYHSTICSRCSEVCHDHCGLNEISSQGSNEFKNCWCMGGRDNCQKCEGRCSYTTHYHARKTMKITNQTLDEVLHDIKAKFDAAQTGKQQQTVKIKSTKDAKEAIEKAITAMTASIVKECIDLKKICSGFNLVDELHEMLTQLKMEARLLQSNDARDTAEKVIRSVQKISDELSGSTDSKKISKSRPKV